MTSPRILIIDNDPRVSKEIKKNLLLLNYQVEIAQGLGKKLLANAIEIAQRFRPHVAIVDLRLLDDDNQNDQSGLDILNDLDSCQFIIWSNYLNSDITSMASKKHGVVGWVDKFGSPLRLLSALDEAAKQCSASHRGMDIQRNSAPASEDIVKALGLRKNPPNDMADDTLAKLFIDAKNITLMSLDGSVVTPRSISRGHSVILKVLIRINPLVIKFAPAKDILKETHNYSTYIEGNIEGEFNAELRKSTTFWDLGAIVYSFLSSANHEASFREFYAKTIDSAAILRPLEHFFSVAWGALYKRPEKLEGSLFDVYNTYLTSDKDQDLTVRLKGFPKKGKTIKLHNIPFPLINPVPWVLRHKAESAIPNSSIRQSITHGDFHGDNIFVDESHAWVIDFERSGPGHNLRDFAELELDILSRLLSGDIKISELLTLFISLTEPGGIESKYILGSKYLSNSEAIKAFEVIKGLRIIAKQVTGFTDFREYYWGLLIDAAFVATLNPVDTKHSNLHSQDEQRKRALLYGAIICGRLEDWRGRWPKVEWQKYIETNLKLDNDERSISEVHIV